MSEPTDSTALVLAHAASGERLPPGDLYMTPISLPFGGNLRGAAGNERTTLRPLTATPGPFITVASPGRSDLSRLNIVGSGIEAQQTGLELRTSGSQFRDLAISGFANGVLLTFSVDNTFRDCDFRGNNCNICGTGNSLPELSVTTTRFLSCGIRYAPWVGAYLAHGRAYDFTGCVVESNGTGMILRATPLGGGKSIDAVNLTNVWFEANGQHLQVFDNDVPVDPIQFTIQTNARKFLPAL